MLRVGYHFSISPEPLKTIDEYSKKYQVGQIFLSSPYRLGSKDVTKRMSSDQLRKIKDLIKKRHFKLFIHANYLINLANPVKKNPHGIKSLIAELKSGEKIGAKGVVFHVGKTRNDFPVEEGITNMIDSICIVLHQIRKFKIKLLLETCAGVGSEIGKNLKEFAKIVCGVYERVKDSSMMNNFGVCIDTAHLHSSGIDLRSKAKAKQFVHDFQREIGFQHVKLIHFNDSAREMGSRVDRHTTIGMGYITLSSDAGLKLIAQVAGRLGIPLVLERSEKLHSQLAGELTLVKKWLAKYTKKKKHSTLIHLPRTTNEKS